MTENLPDPTALPIFQAGTGPAPASSNGHRRVDTHALAGPVPTVPVVAAAPAMVEPAPLLVKPVETALPTRAVASTSSTSGVGSTSRRRPTGRVDWKLVAALRAQASDQLMAALGDERGQDLDADRERGRAIIQELLASTAAERIHDGETPWSMDDQASLAEAVYDSLFGLGRLQPLVDDDSVENIIITGADTVWLEKADGLLVRAEPVADSDAELIDFLQFLASRSESNPRSFSAASPTLHMRLDDGSRLAAAAWITPYPVAVIRRHRLVRVTLDDLVAGDLLTPVQASLLSAAVKAGLSIVVAGEQGAGKTTLMRALCNEIPPHERIGTFETEYELLLHDMRDLHPIIFPFEARDGSGETGADGQRAGEYTIDETMRDSYRMNLTRQIVGEVRGPEVWPMILAMESGAGSLSTTHARNGDAVMRKLVTCAMQTGMAKDVVTEKLADALDLIVQIHLEIVPIGDGAWRKRRWVSEILHVVPGEQVRGYATTRIVTPNPDGGPGLAGTLPDELRRLERYGFDLDGFLAQTTGREVT